MTTGKVLKVDFEKKTRMPGTNYEPELAGFVEKVAKLVLDSDRVEYSTHAGGVFMAWVSVRGALDATLLGTFCYRTGANTWRVMPGEKNGELIIVVAGFRDDLLELSNGMVL